jgi:hypothetical protein
MAPFFHWNWRRHGGRRHWQRWHWPEQPQPGSSPDSSPGSSLLSAVTAPLGAVGNLLGIGETEQEFATAGEEAERGHHRHHRPKWAYQSSNQSEDEFEPTGEETETCRRTGRWVRHNGRIIVLDL